jgi:beta-phosphoglucomutase
MRAAIFDLDGTLVHNMPYHARAWMALCEKYAIAARFEQFEREFAGQKNSDILKTLLGPDLQHARLVALAEEKEALYRQAYRGHVTWLAGAFELIERLRASGVRVAIGSAAPPENRALVLGELSAAGLFDAIIGGEQVAMGKPAPDIFLKAAAAVAVDPGRCVVFEDAVNGILAGRAAGMFTVGLTTVEPAERLLTAGADAVAHDFTALDEETQRRLGLTQK